MSPDAVAYRSRARTTLPSLPDRIRPTAVATARSQSGAGRLPSCQRTSAGAVSGRAGRSESAGPPIVVSHACPSRRPSTALGTTRTEPSQVGSKVKLPNATGPEPGIATWSSIVARSNSSRSHFSLAVNLSSPAGRVILAASPQPTSPSPCRIHASAAGSGSPPTRLPGSAMGTVRTASRSGAGRPSLPRPGSTPANSTCRSPLHRSRGRCASEQGELGGGRDDGRRVRCNRRRGGPARPAPVGPAAADPVPAGQLPDPLAHLLLVGLRRVRAAPVQSAVADDEPGVVLAEPAEEPFPRAGAQVEHDGADRAGTRLRGLAHRGGKLGGGVGQERDDRAHQHRAAHP